MYGGDGKMEIVAYANGHSIQLLVSKNIPTMAPGKYYVVRARLPKNAEKTTVYHFVTTPGDDNSANDHLISVPVKSGRRWFRY